jgi:hypothetical protein
MVQKGSLGGLILQRPPFNLKFFLLLTLVCDKLGVLDSLYYI